MKLAVAYIAIQIAIIIGLAITEPGTVLMMIVMGAVIYGGFFLFCQYLAGPRRTLDDQQKP
jgi:hypothetical protein